MPRSLRDRVLALSERQQLALLFGVAFLLRLAYGLTRLELPEINDMGVYDDLAMSIINGTAYTSALEPDFRSFRAPGYPYFLAAVFSFFGHAALPVVIIQSALSAATCLFVYAIGRDLVNRFVGLVAAGLSAVDAEMIHWSRELITETLYIFLLVLLVYTFNRMRRAPTRGWGVAVGLLLGASALVRPNVLLLIPFLALYGWFGFDIERRQRLILAAIVAAIFCLVLTPWTVRNYRIHDAFVPIATIGGSSLYGSVPPEAKPGQEVVVWRFLERGLHILPNGYDMMYRLFGVPEPPSNLAFDPAEFDEVALSNQGRDHYLAYVRDHPGDYARLLITKASLIFNPLPPVYAPITRSDFGFGEADVIVRYYVCAFILVAFVFGAVGVVSTFDLRSPALLLHAVLAYHIVFQLLFRPALRYFLPGLVLCSIFTAAGAWALRNWRSRLAENPESARPRMATAGVLALAVLANSAYQMFGLRGDIVAHDWSVIVRLFSS